MHNGYGWYYRGNYGYVSGLYHCGSSRWNKKTGYIGFDKPVIDTYDPENICYSSGKRTDNAGSDWTSIGGYVYYCYTKDNGSVVLSNSKYSEDNGDTWSDLGISSSKYAKDEESGKLFAYGYISYHGVYVNEESQPQDQWTDYGLTGVSLSSLAVCNTSGQDYIFAVSSSGNIYRAEF